MKIFTHTYKVEIFNNGKFCWRNHGWIEKGINDLRRDNAINFVIIMILFAALAIK
jgi:hypothetical protein